MTTPRVKTSLIDRLFCAHPRAAGECYFRHLRFSLVTSGKLVYAALCLTIHGLFPFLCEKTASNQICGLSRILDARRTKTAAEQQGLSPPPTDTALS